MAAPTNLDWLFHLLGWVLGAAGAVLLLWALFWDRSRGRRRCPKCWYDMGGVPGLKCPECGRECSGKRSLFRTRRHRFAAALGLIVILGSSQVWSVPRIRRDGWVGAVPTSLLVFGAPMGEAAWEEALAPEWRVLRPPKATLLDLTLQRMDGERPWRWQSQVFFDRLFEAHPGEILNALGVPKVWPAGVPLRLRLNPGYASSYCGNQATVSVRLHATGAEWTGSDESQNMTILDPGCIGPVMAGTNTTKFEVELRSPRGLVWRGLVIPRLKVSGTIEDYFKGVEPPDIEEQIVGRHPRISFTDGGEVFFTMDNDLRANDTLSCTLAVDIELIRDGKSVGRASLYRFNIGAWTSIPGPGCHISPRLSSGPTPTQSTN